MDFLKWLEITGKCNILTCTVWRSEIQPSYLYKKGSISLLHTVLMNFLWSKVVHFDIYVCPCLPLILKISLKNFFFQFFRSIQGCLNSYRVSELIMHFSKTHEMTEKRNIYSKIFCEYHVFMSFLSVLKSHYEFGHHVDMYLRYLLLI